MSVVMDIIYLMEVVTNNVLQIILLFKIDNVKNVISSVLNVKDQLIIVHRVLYIILNIAILVFYNAQLLIILILLPINVKVVYHLE